jgi:hypothetical protein
MTTSRGIVHGNTIMLDNTVPPLEGKRVLVLIEPLEDGETLDNATQARLWNAWAESGPQGPIEDEGEIEFP